MPQYIDVPGHGTVEFPDGMSEDEMGAAIKKNFLVAKSINTPTPPARLPAYQSPDAPETNGGVPPKGSWFSRNWLPGVADTPTPDLNAVNRTFKEGIGQGLNYVGTGIGQRLGLVTPDEVAERRRLDAPLLATGMGKVGSMFGQAAPFMGASALTPAPASFLGSLASGAGQGAVQGALQPTATGESVRTNAAVGGAIGGVLGGGANLVGRLLSSKPIDSARAAILDRAKALGYKIPIGQQTNSTTLKNIDEALKSLPSTSGKMADMAENNQNILTQTVAAGIGKPEAKALTAEVLTQAHADLGRQFSDLSKGTVLDTTTPQFGKAIADLKAELANLDPQAAKAVLARLQPKIAMLEKWQQQGSIPGEVYQANRTFLSKAANDSNGALAHYYGELVKAVDSAAPNTPAWAAVRQQYALLKTLEAGKGSAVSTTGEVSGPKLAAAMRGRDSAAYLKNQMGAPGEAARIAETFKTDIPNSATAQRTFWMNALTNPLSLGGGGAAAGGAYGYATGGQEGMGKGAAAGAAVGILGPKVMQGILYNPAAQKFILSGGMGDGMRLLLQRALPALGTAAVSK